MQSHSSSELQNRHVFSSLYLRVSCFVARTTPSSDALLEIMKEYRRVDDSITMRLNRNSAQWHDRSRMPAKSALNQEAGCESFWRELVGAQDGIR
jgi:hypothetical protein